MSTQIPISQNALEILRERDGRSRGRVEHGAKLAVVGRGLDLLDHREHLLLLQLQEAVHLSIMKPLAPLHHQTHIYLRQTADIVQQTPVHISIMRPLQAILRRPSHPPLNNTLAQRRQRRGRLGTPAAVTVPRLPMLVVLVVVRWPGGMHIADGPGDGHGDGRADDGREEPWTSGRMRVAMYVGGESDGHHSDSGLGRCGLGRLTSRRGGDHGQENQLSNKLLEQEWEGKHRQKRM
mmetsp:Transcript_26154/g.64993  ORF Transcript_26154/g.64993 Transcript_26154/m.64993 type:complete len:236 (-) Transcript_26154:92-799(-)